MSFTREQQVSLDYYLTTDPNDDKPMICSECDNEIAYGEEDYIDHEMFCPNCYEDVLVGEVNLDAGKEL
tara:strand:- start:792 stop:998 length:207 start_codon:yes stop_codon:yes gene_type:complete